MNQSRQIKIGAVLSYLQMGLGVLVNLAYIPLMIRILGKAEYGLYSVVSSTVSMLSILNLGFSSSFIRYYSKYKKDDDRLGIAKVNGLFLLIFSVIGLVAMACGLFLTSNLHMVFKDGLTKAEYEKARILMLLLTLNLTISFPMTVFTNIITARERFIFLKSLAIVKTVCSPLLTIPLLLSGFGLVSIVAVTLTVSVTVDCIYLYYCFRRLSEKFMFRDFEKGILKDVLVFTSFLAINILVNQINLNIDPILLGRFKGTEVVAVYALAQTLYTYFQLFSTSVSNLFTPRVYDLVNRYEGEEQRKKLTELFVRVGRIQFLILSYICTGIIFFGKSFITNYWAGAGYSDSYYVLLLLAIPSMIPLTQNVGIEIQRAENRHKFRSIAYLIMAVFNLLLSIVLCQRYGAIGCAVGTCASFLLANGLIINIYYHKKCNINIISYWKSFFRMSAGLIIPIVVGSVILFRFHTDTIGLFVLFVAVYTVIYWVSMWFFSMNESEKQLIKGSAGKLGLKVHERRAYR